MLVIYNGKFLKEENASVSINNRSFRYGDGCFETIKVVNGRMIHPDFHMERLFSSLEALQFELPAFLQPESLTESVLRLVNRNGHQSLARVRINCFAGDGGIFDEGRKTAHYLVQSWPLNPVNNEWNDNGLVLGLYSGGFKAADALSNIKNNNFLLYALAAGFAKKNHWNDALVSNHFGTIADACIANLFIINGNTITTPPLSDGPVNGTMRRYLLREVTSLGYTLKQESIDRLKLLRADEFFLSNAIYGIRWVKEFEGREFQSGHTAAIYRKLIAGLWQ